MTAYDNGSALYLRSDVMLEPLFDAWYAWSYLIPPATAARNITHRHLPIIDSYLKAPGVHAAAVKNPKLLGGPFIDYEGGRLEEIRQLRADTTRGARDLIQLSLAIQQLDDLMKAEAKGYSLQPLYPRVPSDIRGLVELSYDLNNQASFRFLEPLLYKSRYYKPELQSVLLSVTSSDERAFTLSTPRLASPESLELRLSFADERLDFLAGMKRIPKRGPEIIEALQLNELSRKKLEPFLTTVEPTQRTRYGGNGVRWRYFGHACILIETKDCSILFDPVVSYTYDSSLHRFTYDDLPSTIDYVVITHNHQDHVLLETLLQLRSRIGKVIVPRASGRLQDPSMGLLLDAIGFKNVVEISELQELTIGDGSITGIPFFGEHADLDIQSKLGYIVRFGTYRLLFASDSCNLEPELYKRVHDVVGDVDALFLGMECDGAPLSWLYGPLLTRPLERAMDQSRRLSGSNCGQGSEIIDIFSCKNIYVYAMGQEPWLNYIMSIKYTDSSNPIVQSNALLSRCHAAGLIAERLFGEREILMET